VGKRVLVTGGCGYIGSHVVRQLSEAGWEVTVYDNLSTGFADALIHGEELVVGDLADTARLDRLLEGGRFRTLLHFAAAIVVPESVADPLRYYGNNTRNTLHLLQAAVRHGVERFVFSSTAAVYGLPADGIADESTPTAPINPYGRSKLMSEWMLQDAAAAHGISYGALRYFNVAGADPLARMGQRSPEATHLIKVACQAALGLRPELAVFGTDYDTPDGTCIRDYIHIEDLAAAHLAALDYLAAAGPSLTVNVGYGRGASVREVVATVRQVTGRTFPVRETGRRAGDPAVLVARAERVRSLLGWTPRYDDLTTIVQDAWRWETVLKERT
jgi:UDP-glucose 4-epimerase